MLFLILLDILLVYKTRMNIGVFEKSSGHFMYSIHNLCKISERMFSIFKLKKKSSEVLVRLEEIQIFFSKLVMVIFKMINHVVCYTFYQIVNSKFPIHEMSSYREVVRILRGARTFKT